MLEDTEGQSASSAIPIIENLIVSVHDLESNDRVLGISIEWSDGVYTFGFCDPRDMDSYLWELVEAREKGYMVNGSDFQETIIPDGSEEA